MAEIHALVSGEGPHDLLLVHGYAASNFTWRNWLPELENHGRVHRVELPGHGDAPAPRDFPYTPDAFSRALLRYVDGLDGRPVVLVGHSMGGGIALLTALRLQEREPDRLVGFVSVAGAAYPQHLPPFVRWAGRPALAEFLFRVLPKRPLIRAVLRSIVYAPDAVRADAVRGYAAPLVHVNTRRALIRTARHIVPPDLDVWARRFPELRAPTLALWGRQDPVVPLRTGERLAEELPNARLEVLEACGHIPMDEHPEASLAPVLEFLAELEAGG